MNNVPIFSIPDVIFMLAASTSCDLRRSNDDKNQSLCQKYI